MPSIQAAEQQRAPASRPKRNDSLWRYVRKHKAFYFMLVPGMLYFLIFKLHLCSEV